MWWSKKYVIKKLNQMNVIRYMGGFLKFNGFLPLYLENLKKRKKITQDFPGTKKIFISFKEIHRDLLFQVCMLCHVIPKMPLQFFNMHECHIFYTNIFSLSYPILFSIFITTTTTNRELCVCITSLYVPQDDHDELKIGNEDDYFAAT